MLNVMNRSIHALLIIILCATAFLAATQETVAPPLPPKAQQYDLTIADETKAIELNPQSDSAYFNRGLAYYKKGQHDRAIADFNKAIELNPKFAVSEDAEKYSARGKAAFDMAKSDEDYYAAIDEFKKAVDSAPWLAQGYYNLGLAQERAGQIDDAMKNFNLYLLAAPKAKDAQTVKNRIYGLEYKVEHQRLARQREEEERSTRQKREEEERSVRQRQIAGDWYNHADPTQEYTIRHQVTVTGNNIEIRPAWMYVRESNNAREPSWIPYRTDGFSPPVWRGTIKGLTITGTFHGDNSNWNGGANYTRPMSGSISPDGKTLRLRYKAVSPAGGSKYPRLVTGWEEIDQELVLWR